MMLSSLHLGGFSLGSGTMALVLLSAGAVFAVAIILIVAAFRRTGASEATNALWGGVLVLVGAAFTAVLIEHPGGSSADRMAIERQAVELTARAIAPGSALACLDAVANAVVDACEKAVFARPQSVSAAVDYVDARVSLLAASAGLADHEPSLRPMVERLRGALEPDRFGIVAHVLTMRGCSAPNCADLKLLRDPSRVVANMTSHAFEARVGVHAIAWQDNGAAAPAAAAMPAEPPLLPPMASIASDPKTVTPPATSGVAPVANGHMEFPSAASIPPVSIMTPEPGPSALPPSAAEPKPVPPPKHASPPRRQSTREQPSAPPVPHAAPVPQPQRAATTPALRPPQPPQRAAAAPAPPLPPVAAVPPPEAAPAAPASEPLPSHGIN